MPVIDENELTRMTGGDDELVADLAIMFVQQLSQLKARVRIGIENGNHEDVEEAAHQLKSRVSYFGATELRQQVADFEDAVSKQATAELREMQSSLFNVVDELVDELRHLTNLSLELASD